MTYFQKFPHLVYSLDGKESVVKDILRRATFISEYKPVSDMYHPYLIIDGDTPQTLGMRFYGAATYHWVIQLFNEIHNPYFDWPLGPVLLEQMCSEKYGNTTMYMTRHHELNGIVIGEIKEFKKGIPWVPPIFTGEAVAISFFDYEERLNDDLRKIAILRPELLGEFVKQFESSINQ